MWDIFSQWIIIHIVKNCLLFKKLFLILVQAYSPSPAPEYEALYIGPSEVSLYYNNIVICLSVMDVRHGFYRSPTI